MCVQQALYEECTETIYPALFHKMSLLMLAIMKQSIKFSNLEYQNVLRKSYFLY